jgi:hypothetical protein
MHILIPGLLGRLVARAEGAEQFPRFEPIETLLARAQRSHATVSGYESQLCALFDIPAPLDRDLPLGAIRHFGITGEPHKDFFMCADPIHLQADIQQAYLLDSSQLEVSQDEARILTDLFNEHFSSEDLFYLEADDPCCWHLRLSQPQSLRTQPLHQVRGGDVSAYFPSGEHASYWRGILNETQMLYYAAEPNRKREAEGRMMLNSLWFYGSGRLPQLKEGNWDRLWGADPLMLGLSKLVNIDVHKVPQDLESLLDRASQGRHLLCLDELAIPSSYDNFAVWQHTLQLMQKKWFILLNAGLKSGFISECTLYDCSGQQFKLRGSNRWRFWRKPQPLTKLLA